MRGRARAGGGAAGRADRPSRLRSRSRSPPPEPGPPSPRRRPAAARGLTLVDVRRLWPDIVESTKTRRRMAWIHLTQNCQVVGLDGNVLTLGFANAGARDSFVSSGCAEVVHQAAIDVVGADWKIETIVDPGAQPEGTPAVTTRRDRAAGRRRPQPPSRQPHRGAGGPPAWAADAGPRPRPSPPASRRHPHQSPTPAPRPPPARRSSRPGPRAPRRPGPTTWPPPTPRPAATTSTPTPRGSAARTCSPASWAPP